MARPTTHESCTVDRCNRPHMAKGWCARHYMSFRKYGDPLRVDTLAARTCGAPDGCPEQAGRSGFCRRHLLKRRRDQGLQVRRGDCSVEGCGEPHEAKGFCEDHYYRWRAYGDPLHELQFRKGTGHVTKEGYRVITVKGRPMFEHRHVMEQFLGRELLAAENVHHRNGDRLDNRIENLELWSSSQPAGQRVADKLAWARELLTFYEGVEGTCVISSLQGVSQPSMGSSAALLPDTSPQVTLS